MAKTATAEATTVDGIFDLLDSIYGKQPARTPFRGPQLKVEKCREIEAEYPGACRLLLLDFLTSPRSKDARDLIRRVMLNPALDAEADTPPLERLGFAFEQSDLVARDLRLGWLIPAGAVAAAMPEADTRAVLDEIFGPELLAAALEKFERDQAQAEQTKKRIAQEAARRTKANLDEARIADAERLAKQLEACPDEWAKDMIDIVKRLIAAERQLALDLPRIKAAGFRTTTEFEAFAKLVYCPELGHTELMNILVNLAEVRNGRAHVLEFLDDERAVAEKSRQINQQAAEFAARSADASLQRAKERADQAKRAVLKFKP